MTENDAKKIMLVMTVAYPNYKVADIDATAQIWARLLSDYTYSQVDAALRAYILTERIQSVCETGPAVTVHCRRKSPGN